MENGAGPSASSTVTLRDPEPHHEPVVKGK